MRGITQSNRPPVAQARRASYYAVWGLGLLSLFMLYHLSFGSMPRGPMYNAGEDANRHQKSRIPGSEVKSAYDTYGTRASATDHVIPEQPILKPPLKTTTKSSSAPPHLSKYGYVPGASEFVLVLGGGGPVGQALKQTLRERGVAILSVDNRDILDLREPDALNRAFEHIVHQITLVYVLASDVSSSRSIPDTSSHTLGTPTSTHDSLAQLHQHQHHRDLLWASSEAMYLQIFSWLNQHSHVRLVFVSSHVAAFATSTGQDAATTQSTSATSVTLSIKHRGQQLASQLGASRARIAVLWHVLSEEVDDLSVVSEVMNQCLVRNAATAKVSKAMLGHLNFATAREVAQGLVALKQEFDHKTHKGGGDSGVPVIDLAPSTAMSWNDFVAAVDAAVAAVPQLPGSPATNAGCKVTLTMIKDVHAGQKDEPRQPADAWFRQHVASAGTTTREAAIMASVRARYDRLLGYAQKSASPVVGIVVRVAQPAQAKAWVAKLTELTQEYSHVGAPGRVAFLITDLASTTLTSSATQEGTSATTKMCEPHTSDVTCNVIALALAHLPRAEYLAYIDDYEGKLYPPTRSMIQSLVQRRRFPHSVYLAQNLYSQNVVLPFADKRRVIGLCNCDKACGALPETVFFSGAEFAAKYPMTQKILVGNHSRTSSSSPRSDISHRRASCDVIPNVMIAHRRVWKSMVWPSQTFVDRLVGDTDPWTFSSKIAALAMAGCGNHGTSHVVLTDMLVGSLFGEASWFVPTTTGTTSDSTTTSCSTSLLPPLQPPSFLHRIVCSGSMTAFTENDEEELMTLADLKPQPPAPTSAPVLPPTAPPTAPPVAPACYPECTIMPVIVAWPAVIREARELVGVFTERYKLGAHSGIVVVSQDLTYKQVAELTSIENVVVVSRERMNRVGDLLDPVSLQLHGFELAMSTLPSQHLVFMDVTRKNTNKEFPDLDELRHSCSSGIPIKFGPSDGHLPHILIPGRDNAACKKKRAELREWVKSTTSCVERVWETGFPVPSKDDCASKARSFVDSWLTPASKTSGLTVHISMPNAEICSMTHIRRSPDPKDLHPIPEANRKNSICIGTPTLGKRPWAEHPMFRNLLRTLVAGISSGSQFVYRHYVVYEDGDPVLDTVQGMREFIDQWQETWKSVDAPHEVFPVRVPFAAGDTNYLSNVLFHHAYEDGCEYLWYLCDDISIQNKPWDMPFVDHMRRGNPPNVGMVGTSLHFNTQPFVHRSHLDIFGIFYPRETHNWYGDTTVYDAYKAAAKMNGPAFDFSNQNAGGYELTS